MFNIANKTAHAVMSIKRLAAGMATVAPRIGDKKVPMSRLEPNSYINYQRIEDNLAVVRQKYVHYSVRPWQSSYTFFDIKVEQTIDII